MHRWETRPMGGNPADASSCEHVVYCADCGIDNAGDPAEFPNLFYSTCPLENLWKAVRGEHWDSLYYGDRLIVVMPKNDRIYEELLVCVRAVREDSK